VYALNNKIIADFINERVSVNGHKFTITTYNQIKSPQLIRVPDGLVNAAGIWGLQLNLADLRASFFQQDCLLVINKSTLVAFLSYKLLHSWGEGGVRNIAVLNKFQGNKLGRYMWELAKQDVFADCKKITSTLFLPGAKAFWTHIVGKENIEAVPLGDDVKYRLSIMN